MSNKSNKSNKKNNKSVHLLISGRVTNVGFRNFVCRNALKLGLTGWVKNTPDGQVEALASGKTEKVDEMLELIWRGPGRVSEVKKEQIGNENFPSFEIRY